LPARPLWVRALVYRRGAAGRRSGLSSAVGAAGDRARAARVVAAAARVPGLRAAGVGRAAGGRVVERVRAAVARARRRARGRASAVAREDRRAGARVLRTGRSLPPQGLSTLGFDAGRFPPTPPACYPAPWRLSGQSRSKRWRTTEAQPTLRGAPASRPTVFVPNAGPSSAAAELGAGQTRWNRPRLNLWVAVSALGTPLRRQTLTLYFADLWSEPRPASATRRARGSRRADPAPAPGAELAAAGKGQPRDRAAALPERQDRRDGGRVLSRERVPQHWLGVLERGLARG